MPLRDPDGIEFEYVGGPFDGLKDRQVMVHDFIVAPPIAGGDHARYRLDRETMKYIFVPHGEDLIQ